MLSKVTPKSAFAAVMAAALMAGAGSAGSGELLLNSPAQSAAVHDLIDSDIQFGCLQSAKTDAVVEHASAGTVRNPLPAY
jgi:hypothetical protein